VRIVHLADLHLGFRQYQRLTPAGINQRESDVAAVFVRAIDKVIELAPDIVLFAGDVFHQVRPTNPAILHAFSQLARLMRALPDSLVVMIAGNHDTPRARDTVCILRLFTQLGIHVVDGEAQRLHFADRRLSILAVPDIQDLSVEIVPDLAVEHNILIIHAEVEGLLPQVPGHERAALIVPREVLAHPRWDYVAMGHYHVHREVAPKGWYSGALEYTSTNPWGERREEKAVKLGGKGIIEFDTEAKPGHTFHPVPAARVPLDLPAIEGRGLGAADLDTRIASAIERAKGGIDDRAVRLVLRDVPRYVARDLDHRALREYRRRALHFHLDVRPPELTRTSGAGAPGRSSTLVETLRARLRDRPLDAELNRERFVELGLSYLQRVEPAAMTPGDGEPGP
jgi:DNA repair exonuclease SbcCD nuclease subunit